MYTLSPKALKKIESLRPTIIYHLAIALAPSSDDSINRYIRENRTNGDLTKYAALEVLQQETGLSVDELLNDVRVRHATKKQTA